MYLGSAGSLSVAVLSQLLEKTTPPACIATSQVVAVDTLFPPIQHSADPLFRIAYTQNINYLSFEPKDTHALAKVIKKLHIKLLVSVCYPVRVDTTACLEVKTHAYNLHPSRLPQYRGPDPVFWQLRQHESDLGITLHQMSDVWDAGPIVSQISERWPAPLSYDAICQKIAARGADMIAELIHTFSKSGTIQTQAQDTAHSSYAPWPTAADSEIRAADWTVRDAQQFIQGLLGRGDPLVVTTSTERFHVRGVPSVQLSSLTPLSVQFMDGILWFARE